MTSVPHFAIPLTLGPDGDFLTVDQDSEREVAQCAIAVLRTPLGHRELAPTLGLADTTHTLALAGESAALAAIEQQLLAHEPRAEYEAAAAGVTPGEWIDAVEIEITGVKPNG